MTGDSGETAGEVSDSTRLRQYHTTADQPSTTSASEEQVTESGSDCGAYCPPSPYNAYTATDLGSDCAGKAPYSVVLGSTFSAAPDLEGEGDALPLHPDWLSRPALSQHTAAPNTKRVATEFTHLGSKGVATSKHHNLMTMWGTGRPRITFELCGSDVGLHGRTSIFSPANQTTYPVCMCRDLHTHDWHGPLLNTSTPSPITH